jgi:hypothetical protein
MKLTAKIIKYILMDKYRFNDQLMVTSECGGFCGIADIMTYDLKKEIFVEIEIKISKQDLKNDIKKMKHHLPLETAPIHKFYYAVPTFLVNYCKEYLDEHGLPYGIIEICTDQLDNFKLKAFEDSSGLVKVVKKCKLFHKNKPPKSSIRNFMMRISSELVSRERSLLQLKSSIESDEALQIELEKYKCCGNCYHPDLSDDFCAYADARVYKQHKCGNWKHFRDVV